ncbi:MAG: biotin/lipoyl-containing protein [Nitrososphaerota archaeon]|nr:biotin/lipoyl-containing protein [Nitrososphaerota archaeon]
MGIHLEEVTSPLSGKVLRINVKVGDRVDENTSVLVLESMKMEIDIYPSSSGVVKEIKVKEGEDVESGHVLMLIE